MFSVLDDTNSHFFIYFSDGNRRRLHAVPEEGDVEEGLPHSGRGTGRELTAVGRFRKLRARPILRGMKEERETGAWEIPV